MSTLGPPISPDAPALGAWLWTHAHVGLAMVDAQGIIRRANPCLAAMLGYAAVEIEGRHMREITAPTDQAAHARQFERAVRSGEEYEMVQTYVTKTGRRVLARLFVSAFRSGGEDAATLMIAQVRAVDLLSIDGLSPEDRRRFLAAIVGEWALQNWRKILLAAGILLGLERAVTTLLGG